MTLPSDLTTHPFPNNQRQFDAEFFRLMMQAVLSHGSAQGIAGASTDFAVSVSSGLTLNIAAGRAFVKGSERSTQGSYFVYNDTTRQVTCATAHATLPRIDRIVLRCYDSDTTAASSRWEVAVVSGTATATASLTNLLGAATVPDNSLLLANVLVAAADTSLASGDIQDRRYNVPIAGRTLFGATIGSASDSGGTGDKLNTAAIGDGITPVVIKGHFHPGTNGAAGTNVTISVRDAASGGGNVLAKRWMNAPGSGYALPMQFDDPIAAYSGSKSFYANLQNSSGTPTEYAGLTGAGRLLRIVWGD